MTREVTYKCDGCGKPMQNYNSRNSIPVKLGQKSGGQQSVVHFDFCTTCLNREVSRMYGEDAPQQLRTDFVMRMRQAQTDREKNGLNTSLPAATGNLVE